jgi:hypothetical protein
MGPNLVPFRIERLQATVPDGVPVEWQGKIFNSGALHIALDESATESSKGMLDYEHKHARAEFHVRLEFPDFGRILEDLGVSSELTQPVRAVLVSTGDILDDHSFLLSGQCTLQEHGLFPASETRASVLPGH